MILSDSSIKKCHYRKIFWYLLMMFIFRNFWHWKLTLKVRFRHCFWFLSFKNFTTEVTLTFINNICKILPILQILKIFMATFIAKIVGCHCQKWWWEHLPTAENFANCQWQNYHPLPFSNIANGRSYLIYKERKTCCF